MTKTSSVKIRVLLIVSLLLAALPLCAEPIEFRQAIQLALKHSGAMVAASADRARAVQRYRAERYAYFPTVVFGVSPGYSVGTPVTVAGQVPSLYNITHTQTLFNLASQASLKAAHSDTIAASIDYVDRGEQVILDTALLYVELNSTTQRLDAAKQQKDAVAQAFYIAQQRQQEGVGSLLDSKRAELDVARVDLRIAELQTNLDVLREKLGRVIGRSPASIETVASSIPAPPPMPSADDVSSIALANSASVRIADEHLRAAKARARAEHRVNYPSIDLAGQYAELYPYINYGLVNPSNHNYSFAFNIHVPLLNLSQNARAAAADADALHAEADAQTARDQVAADAVRSEHTINQLQAAARVSHLEFEIAQANIDAVKLQIQQGHANARDEEIAVADVAGRQITLLESQFEYLRAQLQLLRQTGELHSWALGTK